MIKWSDLNKSRKAPRPKGDLDWTGSETGGATNTEPFYRLANRWFDHNDYHRYHVVYYPDGWYGESEEEIEFSSVKAAMRWVQMRYMTGADRD